MVHNFRSGARTLALPETVSPCALRPDVFWDAGGLCGCLDDGFPVPASVVALVVAFRSIAEGLNR